MGTFAFICFIALPMMFGLAFREIRPAIAGLMIGTLIFVLGVMWTVISEAVDSPECGTSSDTSGCW